MNLDFVVESAQSQCLSLPREERHDAWLGGIRLSHRIRKDRNVPPVLLLGSSARSYVAVLPSSKFFESSMIGKMLPWLQECIKRWTKPVTLPLISGLMLATYFIHHNLFGKNVSFSHI